MKHRFTILNRKIHYWASLIVAIPLLIIVVTGIILLLKKDVEWIQPSTQRGQSAEPVVTMAEAFTITQSVEEAGVTSWDDFERIDYRVDRNIFKVILKNRWEIQIDASSSEILQVAYRRSDLIETIHDGSFFTDIAKYFIWLPTGITTFVLLTTGMVLFIYPILVRRKRRRKREKAVSSE